MKHGLPQSEICPYCLRRFHDANGVNTHISRKHKHRSRSDQGEMEAKMRAYHNDKPAAARRERG